MTEADFSAYFYNQVLLPYHEFKQSIFNREIGNQKDKRLALAAAVQLYHLREYLPPNISISDKQIAEIVPDFDLLGAIANASKHNILNNKRWKKYIRGSDSIEEIMIICYFEDDDGQYSHAEKTVIVNLVDGSTRDLLYVLTNVMNMWIELLSQLGLIDSRELFSFPSRYPVSRADASSIKLTQTRGQPLNFNIMGQRYDYQESKFVAIPIREGKIKLFEPGNSEPVLTKDIVVSNSEEN